MNSTAVMVGILKALAVLYGLIWLATVLRDVLRSV